ncbi:lactonase family protein [Pontibacter sp. JH31]|uniref:Lactonase family protein n=1 Tax=Pontibacter aquaedesilientis TaxID=2766980 RepID=A0ABR7XE89_9BACT|nr:lactonase family protein [Pontibacter aquaedesilientis]MBD1396609.1 lactonase family protein [Pontibacter aquaedesilientis]
MTHKQRSYGKVVLAVIALLLASCNSPQSEQKADKTAEVQSDDDIDTSMVYVGTYAKPEQESIWLYRLNTATGELRRVLGVRAGENPSYLALDKDQRFLYAVNETGNYQGEKNGAVSAFAIDQKTGDLKLLNKVPSYGMAPCHISLDEPNKTIMVANYTGGNIVAFPIQENGTIGEELPIIHPPNTGSGPNKERQEAGHAHYIGPSPDGRFAFSVDLGTDEILRYKLNSERAAVTTETYGKSIAFAGKPGAGPRHMIFHPDGRFAYVINELNSTMTALAYDSEKGEFAELQTISTLSADYKGDNSCAAVKVSADGKYLYGSNRGHNSIVVYAIDGGTGKLTLVQHQATGGDWPRDFTLDLTGNVMLVANERSNSIVSFKVDKASGRLTPAGYEVKVQKPVCLQVVPAF